MCAAKDEIIFLSGLSFQLNILRTKSNNFKANWKPVPNSDLVRNEPARQQKLCPAHQRDVRHKGVY